MHTHTHIVSMHKQHTHLHTHIHIHTHTHSIPGFVAGSHPSFCLPHTLALCNTWLISNSFQEPLHSNYQRRVRGKVSSWDRAAHSPLWSISEYFKSRETISSWHIINYTCRSFPLGRSSDTLENKSPDVVLNQRPTACEAGISADTFKKWANGFSERSVSGERHCCVRSKGTIDWLPHFLPLLSLIFF